MTSNSLTIPKAIYFDTNVIMQLPYWSSNVNFIELRESAQLIGVPLFVPELVAKEIVQRRIETACDQLRKLKENSSGLGTLLNRKPLEYEKVESINKIINNIPWPDPRDRPAGFTPSFQKEKSVGLRTSR